MGPARQKRELAVVERQRTLRNSSKTESSTPLSSKSTRELFMTSSMMA